ncbi:hypothetical protein ZIOFF_066915 [Zingiber officinale]|uniref:Uncharacterized protein n=1 Tax=Zingiber officinale TaxID=94328 RepID=A0A8J5BIY2_ZINOF|nr:hypothetical protein ZIOFF_066915 [Zingiber officinale]
MAGVPRASFGLAAIMVLALAIFIPAVRGQAPAPTPTSDASFACFLVLVVSLHCNNSSTFSCITDIATIPYWTSIDQGIAYLLMLVALVLTYLIHPLDASSPYKLF